MPQSRKRKIPKSRKRPTGPLAQKGAPSKKGRERTVRIVAIVIILALAAGGLFYLFAVRKGSQTGAEVKTASGLRYVDNVVGDGPSPKSGQTVTVHYTGTLENGKKFDSSYDRGKPADFVIGRGMVIKGWDEGLMSMKVGGKRKLIIPPGLGYGPAGKPPDIPGNSTLVFDVELLGVK